MSISTNLLLSATPTGSFSFVDIGILTLGSRLSLGLLFGRGKYTPDCRLRTYYMAGGHRTEITRKSDGEVHDHERDTYFGLFDSTSLASSLDVLPFRTKHTMWRPLISSPMKNAGTWILII